MRSEGFSFAVWGSGGWTCARLVCFGGWGLFAFASKIPNNPGIGGTFWKIRRPWPKPGGTRDTCIACTKP